MLVLVQGKISRCGLNTNQDNPNPRRSMLRPPVTSSLSSLPCDMLHPPCTGLGVLTRAGRPSMPSSLSLLSSLLTLGWGRGRPQIFKKKKKSSLNHNLIHNLQAIQPVILVPLDHFLFFLFFPLPHLCYPLLPVFGGFLFFFLFFRFCFVLFCFFSLFYFCFPPPLT